MASEGSKKRKREDDPPRITFNTPSRTFERLFKETSLGDLSSAVSKKLGLSTGTKLEFAQIRGSKLIDLEDDDDFEAFKAYAVSNGSVEVNVNLLGSTGVVQAAQPQTQPNVNMEHTGAVAVPPDKKKKTSHDKPALQSEVPMTLEQAITAAHTPQSVKKPKRKKPEAVVTPEVQSASGLQSTPIVSDMNGAPLVKKKLKRKEEQASPVEPVASSSTTAVDDSATEMASQKKRKKKSGKSTSRNDTNTEAQSLEKSMSIKVNVCDVKELPNASEAQEAPSVPIVADTNSLAKDGLVQADGQEVTANTKPPKARKKKSNEKTSEVDTLTGNAANAQSSVVSSSTVPLPIPSTALSVPSGDTLLSESTIPLNEPKKTKSKNPKVAVPSEAVITTPTQGTLPAEPSSAAPTNKKKATKKQLGNVENDATTELPSKGEAKAKNRKLTESDSTGGVEKSTASKSVDAKKLKAIDAVDKLAPTAPSLNLNTNKNSVPEAAPTIKTRASARKKSSGKKEDTTNDNDDDKLDKLISELLEKQRVSGSSTQTHPPALVTTAVSSAPLTKEGPLVTAPVGASSLTTSEAGSKKKQKSKSSKGKETSVLQAVPMEASSEVLPQVDANVHNVDKESNSSQSSTSNSDKGSENLQSLPQKVDELPSKDNPPDTEESTDPAGQPSQQDYFISEPVVDQIAGNPENDAEPLSEPGDSLVPIGALPLAPSGSNISEILIQSKDEGSSSESDSNSNEDDDSNEGAKVSEKPPQDLPSRPTPFNARTSFPIGNIDSGPDMDMEALLKPKKRLSWRDIPESLEDESDDESEKLLTDLEEENEEENENLKNPRRNSLAFRHKSSSPSADEDEEEDKELKEHTEDDNIGIDNDPGMDPASLEPLNDNAIIEDKGDDSDSTPKSIPAQPVQEEGPEEHAASPSASSSSDESESDEPVHDKPKHVFANRPSLNAFHSLNAIGKRQDLFSPVGTPRPSFALSPVFTFGSQTTTKGSANDADGDDSSSSSSSSSGFDSDGEEKPSIPKERRAGSSLPKPTRTLRSYLRL